MVTNEGSRRRETGAEYLMTWPLCRACFFPQPSAAGVRSVRGALARLSHNNRAMEVVRGSDANLLHVPRGEFLTYS